MLEDKHDPRKSWQECCKRQTLLRALKRRDGNFFGNVSNEWHEAAMKNDFSTLDEVKKLPSTLAPDNFTQTMRTLLKMEEAHEHINRRKLDMFDQQLSIEYKHRSSYRGSPRRVRYYGIKIQGLSRGNHNLVVNDFVIVHRSPKIFVTLKIVSINKDLVLLPNDLFENYRVLLSGRLNVFFVSSGILQSYYERALDRFTNDRSIRGRLFEHESYNLEDYPGDNLEDNPDDCREDYSDDYPEDYFEDSLDFLGDLFRDDCVYDNVEGNSANAEEMMGRLNECQRQAINSILQGTSWPKPYILFGPPGTGKTQTLAVAIGQIYSNQPSKRVLYSASSNTCADQMFDKLRMTKFIGSWDIVRLSARVRPGVVGSRRIVVTTNMKASSIRDGFKFDYVFVDEAAHAHEAETLIPITYLRPSGTLVLAGDPKQLGAVVQCNQASEYGLAISTLERIFSFGIYQRDRESGKYDSRYITKLVVSYRCDPRVLAISNELFYDGESECPNQTPKSLLNIMRIDNPLQFFFVRGCDERLANSTSWRNEMEAECCVNQIVHLYKLGLTPDQIGVISPYKLQTNLIYRKLRDRLNIMRELMVDAFRFRSDKWICKIDAVDAFQGNEREVIIISTVRTPSSSGTKDFINDSRRFNVAISRAKWLVFVIGHKDVLAQQNNWKEFVARASEGLSSSPKQSLKDPMHPYNEFGPLFRLDTIDKIFSSQVFYPLLRL